MFFIHLFSFSAGHALIHINTEIFSTSPRSIHSPCTKMKRDTCFPDAKLRHLFVFRWECPSKVSLGNQHHEEDQEGGSKSFWCEAGGLPAGREQQGWSWSPLTWISYECLFESQPGLPDYLSSSRSSWRSAAASWRRWVWSTPAFTGSLGITPWCHCFRISSTRVLTSTLQRKWGNVTI